MGCVNCENEREAYTLRAHVVGADTHRDMPFCSTDCLEDWV